jgi:hypothetical protein
METAGDYRFVLSVTDDHQYCYRDHQRRPVLEMNSQKVIHAFCGFGYGEQENQATSYIDPSLQAFAKAMKFAGWAKLSDFKEYYNGPGRLDMLTFFSKHIGNKKPLEISCVIGHGDPNGKMLLVRGPNTSPANEWSQTWFGPKTNELADNQWHYHLDTTFPEGSKPLSNVALLILAGCDLSSSWKLSTNSSDLGVRCVVSLDNLTKLNSKLVFIFLVGNDEKYEQGDGQPGFLEYIARGATIQDAFKWARDSFKPTTTGTLVTTMMLFDIQGDGQQRIRQLH